MNGNPGEARTSLRRRRNLALLGIIVMAAVLLAGTLLAFGQEAAPWQGALGGGNVTKAAQAGMDKLDKNGCSACHEEAFKTWNLSPHRRTVGAPQLKEEMQGCAGCHRGIDKHLQDPTSYKPVATRKTARESADLCLDCHKGGGQALWQGGKHSRLQQACTTCHDPHNPASRYMLRKEEPALCADCHAQQVAEGQLPSHHPIAEGKMVCTDCHNVHGEQRGNLGRETNAEACFRCHAEKEGPFTFEHPPVTEDCTTCHRPHGSPNDYLLQVEQPMLCLQCHPGHHDADRTPIVALDPNNPDQTLAGITAFYGRCTSCHSLIHGTDLPSGTENGTFMPGRPASAVSSAEANKGGVALGVSGLTLLGNLMDGTNREYFGFSEPWTGSETSKGSPQFVREYDGKKYERAQLDSTHNLIGDHDLLKVRTQNAGAKDQEIDLYYANPRTSLDLNYQELTHRLGRYDFGDDTSIPKSSGRTQAITHTDLTDGFNRFGIERHTAEARASYRAVKFPNLRWNFGYWTESEKGRKQFTFLERCGACHKVSTTQEIDRITSDLDLGADLTLGRSSLSYNHKARKFENRAPEQSYFFNGLSSIYNGLAPLFGVAETESNYDELRFQTPAGQSLYINGLYRKGDRKNRFSDLNLGVESAGGSATYFLKDNLQLTAGHFASTLNTEAPDEGVDRKLRASRADLNYSGIPKLDLGVGFRREEVDRSSEHELAPRSSDSDIWSASADWRPGARFNMRAQYRTIDTSHKRNEELTSLPDFLPARYIGNPTDAQRWQVLANYLPSNRVTLTGLVSSTKDKWRVSEFGESRSSDQDIDTAGLSVSYLPTKRARLTAGFYRQQGETESDVTYGAEDFTLGVNVFPPIDSTAEYDYDASFLMLRGDYSVNPRWRLFGSFHQTQTDGKVLARDLGDYIDQNPNLEGTNLILNPFDITVLDWWLGAGYRVNNRNEVTLSHQFRKWDNDDKSLQNGDLRVWRLGWQHLF